MTFVPKKKTSSKATDGNATNKIHNRNESFVPPHSIRSHKERNATEANNTSFHPHHNKDIKGSGDKYHQMTLWAIWTSKIGLVLFLLILLGGIIYSQWCEKDSSRARDNIEMYSRVPNMDEGNIMYSQIEIQSDRQYNGGNISRNSSDSVSNSDRNSFTQRFVGGSGTTHKNIELVGIKSSAASTSGKTYGSIDA